MLAPNVYAITTNLSGHFTCPELTLYGITVREVWDFPHFGILASIFEKKNSFPLEHLEFSHKFGSQRRRNQAPPVKVWDF